jgi:hypothetical protein
MAQRGASWRGARLKCGVGGGSAWRNVAAGVAAYGGENAGNAWRRGVKLS